MPQLTRLDVRDIDLQRRRIQVRGEGNKTRTVPLISEEMINDIRHLVGGHQEGAVFPGEVGSAIFCTKFCDTFIENNFAKNLSNNI